MVKFSVDYVCPCLFVNARFSNYINIDEFVNVIEDNGFLKKDFLILERFESIYVCCKDTISFCCKYYPEFYETCLDDCPNQYADMHSINCLDIMEYGFEDICLNCEMIILNFFSKVLIKIEK